MQEAKEQMTRAIQAERQDNMLGKSTEVHSGAKLQEITRAKQLL